MSLTADSYTITCDAAGCLTTATGSIDGINKAGWQQVLQYNGKPTPSKVHAQAVSASHLCPQCAKEGPNANNS